MAFSEASLQRGLDAKLKILGFEANDLLAALVAGGVCNLIFGQTILALPLGVGLPGALLLVLFLSKKGKPKRFLVHYVANFFSPGFYSAGELSIFEPNMRERADESIS